MQPRKISVEIRVDGVTVNSDGIDFHFTCQSLVVDGFDAEVKMKIFNIISDNVDSFMTDGLDLFVETESRFDKRYVSDIIAVLEDADEDADGEEDNEEDADEEDEDKEDADGGISSFCELISGILTPLDDWDDDWDDWGE